MSSLSDEFQVLQPNNAKGNLKYKPKIIWRDFVKLLNLFGEWNVALIDNAYPHNVTNLDKSYKYYLLIQPIKSVISEFAP